MPTLACTRAKRGIALERAALPWAAMGLGTGAASTDIRKWYAVRNGRKTGIFGSWEQVQEQIRDFDGAQMKEFERSEPGGVDRGLLQAKMWLRSGSHPAASTTMPPPAAKPAHTQHQAVAAKPAPAVQAALVPSARRFSPMLLDALHWGFFGDVCGREQALTASLAQAATERRERKDVGIAEPRPGSAAPRPSLKPISNRHTSGDAPTVKRSAKRPRAEIEKDLGDLYARTYVEKGTNRNRSAVQA